MTGISGPEPLLAQAEELDKAGLRDQAEAAYDEAVSLFPHLPIVWTRRAIFLMRDSRPEAALRSIERAISLAPKDIGVHLTAAVITEGCHQTERAMAHYRLALSLDDKIPMAHANLGLLLHARGDNGLALDHLAQAVALAPDNPELRLNYSNLLLDCGLTKEADAEFSALLKMTPSSTSAHLALSKALIRLGRSHDAIAAIASVAGPQSDLKVCLELARLQERVGKLDDALATLRAAQAQHPGTAEIGSRIISLLRLIPTATAEEIATATGKWAEQYADPLTADALPCPNLRDPERRLRIGYIGTVGLRHHTASYSLLPLIEAHDQKHFACFAYSDLPPREEDDITERYREICTLRPTAGLNDAALAKLIRDDGIDILVETYGHPPGSRLLALARKPAPLCVQILTMGPAQLSAMDATFADPYLVPAALRKTFREPVIDLPCALLYRPVRDIAPNVSDIPSATSGALTFASFNQLSKINDQTLNVWGRILDALPNSRLLLKGQGFEDSASIGSLHEKLRPHGIDPARIHVLPYARTYAEHMASYAMADIALDTWPYGSVITACEALWMGVPLVAWSSDRPIGRYAGLFMNELGEPDLVANDGDGYVAQVLALANAPERIRQLRQSLRRRMLASRLCQPEAFARPLEAAYRQLWRTWCAARLH